MEKITAQEFCSRSGIILDVRSPCEFAHAHIPGAFNLPLFSDEERRIVGITYKEQGQRAAIEKGLEIVQLGRITQEIRQIAPSPPLLVTCARGGMRSASMGWLLSFLGYEVLTLSGGYKSYRNWVLQQFTHRYSLVILGGETGSGKTKILRELPQTIVDLEGLAHHRGSVFGDLDRQPSQEQFENDLAIHLFQKKDQKIWVEDESERIGHLHIPRPFFEQMRLSPAVILQVSLEQRVQNCIDTYQSQGPEKLTSSIMRLEKRLGGLKTKMAIDALNAGRLHDCCRILLEYYDKKYRYGMSQRDPKKINFIPSGGDVSLL